MMYGYWRPTGFWAMDCGVASFCISNTVCRMLRAVWKSPRPAAVSAVSISALWEEPEGAGDGAGGGTLAARPAAAPVAAPAEVPTAAAAATVGATATPGASAAGGGMGAAGAGRTTPARACSFKAGGIKPWMLQ